MGAMLLTGLAACSSQVAPAGANVCWKMLGVADQQPTFQAISRDVPNLESCAVQIEGARMMEGQSTTGAYNGHFIFATEEQITSAPSLNAARIRVFEAADRAEIQRGLRTLIALEDADSPPT